MINNLLVATDGSEHAKKALELGADIASKYGATVYLVHAAPETEIAGEAKGLMEAEHMTGKPIRVYMEQIGGRIINEARDDLYSRGVRKIESTVLLGNPAREILGYAKEKRVDMIIVGHNGWAKGNELYGRKIARRISRDADCTCVTVN